MRNPGVDVVQLTPMPEFMRGGERTPCSSAPEFFVHELTGVHAANRDRVAVIICAGCPFLNPCKAFALANPTVKGVWGATTNTSRAAHFRRIRRAAADAAA